ncbi:hypothetical protein ABTP95_20235, partial [Acinetobacter baumannii]
IDFPVHAYTVIEHPAYRKASLLHGSQPLLQTEHRCDMFMYSGSLVKFGQASQLCQFIAWFDVRQYHIAGSDIQVLQCSGNRKVIHEN